MDPILIVDDEKDNLDALRRLLRTQFDIVVSSSPLEALKFVITQPFHLIVSDQRMPEMTGVEFLEKAKGIQPNAIRILLTGYTDVDSVIGAVNRGEIYRYIAKPWDPEDLKLTLRQANEAFQLRRELEKKNEDLRQSNLELDKALVELKGLDAAKARFLSLISHELNTPLTTLNSFVPLLSESKSNLNSDQTKAIKNIQSASTRLGEIVREVVDYVRGASASPPNRVWIPVNHIIDLCLADLGTQAKEKQISFDMLVGKPYEIFADKDRMKNALSKLITELIASAPSKTPIQIGIALNGDKGILRFERMGEALSPHAFKALDFGGDPLKHSHSLGLGLAICKTAVEASGGEIRVVKSKKFPACIEIQLPARSF